MYIKLCQVGHKFTAQGPKYVLFGHYGIADTVTSEVLSYLSVFENEDISSKHSTSFKKASEDPTTLGPHFNSITFGWSRAAAAPI